ncbi:MAG: EpsI family protein, partial [Gammaproteobacteria bacterium]|nr:EpsI family protein [Gammaproteobacteria bacterium]
GALGQVATLQYFAVAAMIPTAIWAVIGTAAAREIAFPLAYLFFMVPIGQFLVPWLMELTAEFTVWTARLSGVSVYKDGLFFTIPSGSFKIVEACSGLRMLIASLAVGVLFAHLVFRSWSKRILFMAAIVIMSLIANTIRAYIVVMIAYYRGMDAVADHITLGYVVFGAVLVVTLAVGSRFADADPADETGPGNASPPEVQPSLWPALLAGSAIVTIVLSTPVAVGALQARAASHPAAPAVLLPMAVADWRGPVDASPGWAPQFSGYDKAYSGNYTRGLDAVDVFVISYARQKQGAELINSENRLFDADHWTQLSHGSGVFESAGGSINYLQDELQGSSGDKRLVRYWYVVDGDPRYRPAAIKLQEFMNSLLGRPTPESLVAISATFRDEPARAPEALDAFIRDVYANTYPLE